MPIPGRRRTGACQFELGDRGRGDLFADVPRLIEIPVIELVGLRLLHRLHDVVVFYLADAEERRDQRDGDRHAGAQMRPAIAA